MDNAIFVVRLMESLDTHPGLVCLENTRGVPSASLKVIRDVIRLSIYAFLLKRNSNIWPNSAPLQDIRLWNPSDFEFDLSRSLKVKCDVIGLTIHGFLSRYTVITCLTLSSHSHSYLLSSGPNHEKLQVHRTPKWPWMLKGQSILYMFTY